MVSALKWYISIVEGMFGQKYLPYFFNLFYMELFSLALPIIPFTVIFILLAVCHKIVEKVTDSRNMVVKALKIMRNIFFVIVALCFGVLLAMVMGTLFVFANDYYYLVVIYAFLGIVAVNVYFVICSAIFVRFLCQPEAKVTERQYYHDSDNSFYESEIESLVERTPTDAPPSKASCFFVALGFVFLVLFATGLIVVFTGVCVSFAPNHFSTALTRAIIPKNALYCQDSSLPCSVYLTMAETVDQMNIHFVTTKPMAGPLVRLRRGGDNQTAISGVAALNPNPFVTRYINTVRVKALYPNEIYYFQVGGQNELFAHEYSFRSLPAENDFTFVAGGDIGTMKNAVELTRLAAAKRPNFIILGGDLAYENSICSCYDIFDHFFEVIINNLVTPEGHLIPIIPVIGNHDAGGYFISKPKDIKFYLNYFPVVRNENEVYSLLSQPNHSHVVGKTKLIALDSAHMVTVESQTAWLKQELAGREGQFNIPLYHVPMFPVRHSIFTDSVSVSLRNEWLPVFDSHNIDVAFEFHAHAYKRTHKIKNMTQDEKGTIYLGDGCMGVDVIPVDSERAWYLAQVEEKAHFFHVSVVNDSISVSAYDVSGTVFDSVNTTKK